MSIHWDLAGLSILYAFINGLGLSGSLEYVVFARLELYDTPFEMKSLLVFTCTAPDHGDRIQSSLSLLFDNFLYSLLTMWFRRINRTVISTKKYLRCDRYRVLL